MHPHGPHVDRQSAPPGQINQSTQRRQGRKKIIMAAPSENPSINHIITFLTALTDGDQPPASGSADSKALEETIRKLHDHASTLELRELGLRALGIVIYRLSSNYEAERTLRNFITGGDRA